MGALPARSEFYLSVAFSHIHFMKKEPEAQEEGTRSRSHMASGTAGLLTCLKIQIQLGSMYHDPAEKVETPASLQALLFRVRPHALAHLGAKWRTKYGAWHTVGSQHIV